MTFRTESRIAIASNVHDVWAYMCDVRRWSEWAPTVLECRVRGGTPLQPGSWLDQRAKGVLGLSRSRSQQVTTVDGPRDMAFAGPLGISAARWNGTRPIDDAQTDAMMWIEVDLAGIMRVVPGRAFKRRIQRVSDLEMVAIKSAVESDTSAGTRHYPNAADSRSTRDPDRPCARASDRDIPQEGEALRRHFPALPGARLPAASATSPGRTSTGLRTGDTVIDIASAPA